MDAEYERQNNVKYQAPKKKKKKKKKQLRSANFPKMPT
jgi:hypothetical protein